MAMADKADRPEFDSPELSADRCLSFRLWAPHARAVTLNAYDITRLEREAELLRTPEGLWEVTLGPLDPGAYRYRFIVDGLEVVDPRNPATSESNDTVWSLSYVPGSELSDTRDVPHGAVSQVTYYSKSLGRPRRLHVYTPPGYSRGRARFPVLYLLHGASDSDASWSTVGRAGFILDNLLAAKQARPMLVVMPAGHTGPFRPRPEGDDRRRRAEEFAAEFAEDIRPYVESNYRVLADAPHRALAGLSMGGGQTMEIAFRSLPDYAYLGVFSSGVMPRVGPNQRAPEGPTWEERHAAALADPALRKNLKLLWIATGRDDFVLESSRATVKLLRKHGFEVTYHETDGGHRWVNWRRYLSQFVPLLFSE